MSVVISVQDTGPCTKQLVIEVPAPAVDAEHRRVLADFGRRASLPGFRKGKVPWRLVEQRFKKDIEQEVLERLVPRYWRQAQAETGVVSLLPPEVGTIELKAGEPLTFTAAVEVRPTIEIDNLEGFLLPEPQVEVTEEEIGEAIEDLRRRRGEWMEVERAAGRGDLVQAEISEVGDEAETRESRPVAFELGDPQIWEELSLAATGLSAGQRAEFSRKQLDQGEDAQERRFELRVKAVKERELPPLDDSFAQAVGEFADLASLQRKAADQIAHRKHHARQHERERSLLDQLRERYPAQLPPGVVEREIHELLTRQAEQLAMQGVDVGKAGIDWAVMGEHLRPQAEKRVHARLVLDAIVEARSIKVAEHEFEAALSAMARSQNTSALALRQSLDRQDRLGALRAQLNRDKAIGQLMGEGRAVAESEEP